MTWDFDVFMREGNPYLWGMTTEVASPIALCIEI